MCLYYSTMLLVNPMNAAENVDPSGTWRWEYEWQGEIHEEREFPALLKTNIDKVEVAIKRLRELHDERKLDALSQKLLFAPTRPAEDHRQHDQGTDGNLYEQ